MLFDSTLRKELARSFGATLVVILTIVITMMLVRTLGQAAVGAVSPQDVVLLLSYTALGHIPTMLSLSLFIAVVVTLSRMYRDSEMVIWFASGVSLTRLVAPVLRAFWPVLVVVAALVLVAWPWGNEKARDLKDRYEQRSDIARVAPGVFQTSSDGRRVFFIEREQSDTVHGRNVFILSQTEAAESVTSAHRGQIIQQDQQRYLLLENGQRNETQLASGERTVASFESYRVLADERAVRRAEERPPKAMKTPELMRAGQPRHHGELAWRFGLVLAAVNLLVLAIGLSASNPRRPSNWNLLFALLAFVVYFNLVNLSQAWVGSGRYRLEPVLLGLHGGVFLFACALILWRERAAVGLWPWARRRSAAGLRKAAP